MAGLPRGRGRSFVLLTQPDVSGLDCVADRGIADIVVVGNDTDFDAAFDTHGGPAATVRTVDVRAGTRLEQTTGGNGQRHMVRAKGGITRRVKAACEETRDERTLVLLADVPSLIERTGIRQGHDVIENLLDTARDTGASLGARVPDPAAGGVAAGLAMKLDETLELVVSGSETQLQPRGRVGGLDAGEMFQLLAPERRRAALYALCRLQHVPSPTALLDHIEAYGVQSAGESLRTTLMQVDLPELEAAGLVTTNGREGTIEVAVGAFQVWPFLELAARTDGMA